jgi:ferredoxin
MKTMAMMITDECVNCDACVQECLREAIYEDDPHYMIDAEKCTECEEEGGSLCIKVCPVDCIVKAA